jgi:hypothetical protein
VKSYDENHHKHDQDVCYHPTNKPELRIHIDYQKTFEKKSGTYFAVNGRSVH